MYVRLEIMSVVWTVLPFSLVHVALELPAPPPAEGRSTQEHLADW